MVRTRVGYTGGSTRNPTYRSIGDHSEAIQIDFDPAVISYRDLLDRFWTAHNPCARTWSLQYRSAIFFHDEEQERLARSTGRAEASRRGREIETAILPLTTFYRAEDYHQKWELRRQKDLAREYEALFPRLDDFVDSPAVTRVNGYLGGNGSLEQLEAELPKLGLSRESATRLLEIVRRRSGRG